MEAAGLVVGVLALVGTFKDCVDLFLYINSARSLTRDYEILEIKLEIERTLFLQWADRVRLLSRDKYDRRLDDPTQQNTLAAILGSIRQLLSDSQKYRDRYGLIPEAKTNFCDTEYQMVSGRQVARQAVSAISGSRLIRFIEDFEKLEISTRGKRVHVSPVGKFRWIIQDKDKFEKLIQELSYFIAKLNELVPDNGEHIATMINDDLKKESLRVLNLVYDASVNDRHAVAAVAEQNRREQGILRSLWFRTIDDRRYSVALPHSQTLRWALEPRATEEDDTGWDNLSEWLQTGTGIYWVSGKAGSGKSTLMKYTYEHAKTLSLLEEWAAGCPLTVASFFFWYLGANEQKTQEGLSRALLFYILDKNPSNIRDLLPNTWQEAKGSKSDEIRAPSAAEMRHAFEELSSGRTKLQIHKFCFFIDGLDEYVGDIRTGISFIKTLAKSDNIKIVVSSRPIPACVDAFSGERQLHLQDLTKADIASYVDAEVGLHPYMNTLHHLDPTNAPKIVEGLVSKASGVFLWIILACRSVLDGFASCDYVPALLRRVDELPPELEDLFSHMLGKVDPRYHGQCAKLLRTCYENKLIPCAPRIHTIGLALADMGWATFDKTTESRLLMCQAVEQRLRSHCCGLLELVRPERDHYGYCFCEGEPHDPTVDSTVDFMHRSVFEFLTDPNTWQLDCLQIREIGYEPNSYLATISFGLLELKNSCIEDVIFYALRADKLSSDINDPTPILIHIERLTRDFCRRGSSHRGPSHRDISYIAVEFGMINSLRAYQELEDPDLSALSQGTPFPLLYHAIAKPFTCKATAIDPRTIKSISADVVQCILGNGADPNEEFDFPDYMYHSTRCERITVWKCWLGSLSKEPSVTALDADITILLINAGADICAAKKAVGEPLSWMARRKLRGLAGPPRDGENALEKWGRIIQLSESAEEAAGEEFWGSKSKLESDYDYRNGRSESKEYQVARVGMKRRVDLDNLKQSAKKAKRAKAKR
ncbi:hypothetical protein Hte_010120 [Hypoxylon texense]